MSSLTLAAFLLGVLAMVVVKGVSIQRIKIGLVRFNEVRWIVTMEVQK